MAIEASSRVQTLFISDPAYDTLVRMARMSGKVNPDNYTNARGMSTFIEFLMGCQMRDARSPDIREVDSMLLEAGMAPEWRLYSPRVRRRIKLTEQALTEATAHCLALGIAYPPAKGISGAPTIHNRAQCMSALLEAIGTEWVDVSGATPDE